MCDWRQYVFTIGCLFGLPVLNFLDLLGESLLLLFLIVKVESWVFSLLEIHGILPNKNIAWLFMNERKHYLHRHFITLNSRARRHNSLPYIIPQHPRCLIAQLTTNELQPLLNFLSLVDLTRLHEAFHRTNKTKEASKAVMGYIARSERIFSVFEQKEFMGYIVLRKRKLSKWRGQERQNDRF